MKPVSAVLREREGACRMATNMTNSEAMVTSAASYTTERYERGSSWSSALLSEGLLLGVIIEKRDRIAVKVSLAKGFDAFTPRPFAPYGVLRRHEKNIR